MEVTPPASQPENNGVMEEQTEGEGLYCPYKYANTLCVTPTRQHHELSYHKDQINLIL